MQITVYGPLRSTTNEKTVTLTFDGGTVEDALSVFVENYPRAKSQLYTTDGRLQISARISVDGERVDLDDDCPADAELTVFPAVQGGVKERLLDRCKQKKSVKEDSEREI